MILVHFATFCHNFGIFFLIFALCCYALLCFPMLFHPGDPVNTADRQTDRGLTDSQTDLQIISQIRKPIKHIMCCFLITICSILYMFICFLYVLIYIYIYIKYMFCYASTCFRQRNLYISITFQSYGCFSAKQKLCRNL